MRTLALVATLVAGGCGSSNTTCADFQELDACDPKSAPTCPHCGYTCRCDASMGRGVWICEGPGCFDLHMAMDLAPPRDLVTVD
jgi:hypothetical protein